VGAKRVSGDSIGAIFGKFEQQMIVRRELLRMAMALKKLGVTSILTAERAHRLGQTRPVTIYRLVTEGTIEEKIVEIHRTKRDLADSLLEGTDMSAQLSTDELLNLLKSE
jgi:hypothetical protein